MTPQKVHSFVSAAVPYVSSFILALFSVIGYFLLQEFGRIGTLQETVHDVENRLNVTEGNRFTAGDGLEVWKEIQNIHVEIAQVRALIPKETPPEWFKQRVDDISDEVAGNSGQLREVLSQLNKNAILIDNISTRLGRGSNGP